MPEPVLYCADEGVVGTAFYVMGYVEGRVYWEPHMPGADAAERTAVYDAMNATLARLHSFDPAAIGLADFGRGENYVGRQVERWSKQYRASQTQEIDAMDAADRLAARAPAARRPGAARAWRLPARQHDPRARTRRRCSRCSTGSSRRSAIRSPTSPIT